MQSNSKRIAKNTSFLYIRMMLVMAVSLYTVRVVLKALGAEDYGIYNVVGGIVTMLSFFSSTMTSASLRFFAFELGKNDFDKLNKYFNITLLCYISLALIIVIIAETIGIWFFYTQLNIPQERVSAAMWVYQCSIISFVLNLFMMPYNSLILARERMNVYAFVGIGEVILKLLIVYVLVLFDVDKLKLYSVLIVFVTLLHTAFYIIYSNINFKESKLNWTREPEMFKEVLGFSGWQLFGAISGVFRSQGINILLNIFFNPTINAARAIAYQINNAVRVFVSNFFTAVNPQITKEYAAGRNEEMMKLVFLASRFCYYLLMIFAIPIIIEVPYILNLWLDDIPNYTVLFTRLVLVLSLVEAISYPFQTAIAATCKIAFYQLVTGGLLILNLPISYIFLKFGSPPQSTMIISIVIAVAAQISRMLFMKQLLNLSIKDYTIKVLFVIISVTILSLIASCVPIILMDEGFLRFIIVSIISILSSSIIIYIIGLTSQEREFIYTKIKNKVSKRR